MIEPDALTAPDTVGKLEIKKKRKRSRPDFFLFIRLPQEDKAAPIDEHLLRMKVRKAKGTKKLAGAAGRHGAPQRFRNRQSAWFASS